MLARNRLTGKDVRALTGKSIPRSSAALWSSSASRMVDSSLRTKLNSIQARDEIGRLEDIRAAEFPRSSRTNSRISAGAEVSEVGQVVFRLRRHCPRLITASTMSQAGEMVEFENGTRGHAPTWKTDNVGM